MVRDCVLALALFAATGVGWLRTPNPSLDFSASAPTRHQLDDALSQLSLRAPAVLHESREGTARLSLHPRPRRRALGLRAVPTLRAGENLSTGTEQAPTAALAFEYIIPADAAYYLLEMLVLLGAGPKSPGCVIRSFLLPLLDPRQLTDFGEIGVGNAKTRETKQDGGSNGLPIPNKPSTVG